MRYILLSIIFITLVLGYGYWHASNHGTFEISIYDASADNSFTSLKEVVITLRDDTGAALASGKSDPSHGTIFIRHPQIGSCNEVESNATQSRDGMNAYQHCFRQHSTWLMEWVRQVRTIDVNFRDCQLETIPVTVKEYIEDWWMWWVPLPHVGGRPYTYFSLSVRIDPLTCRSVS